MERAGYQGEGAVVSDESAIHQAAIRIQRGLDAYVKQLRLGKAKTAGGYPNTFAGRMQRAAEFILARVVEAVSVPHIAGQRTPSGAPPRQRTGRLKRSLHADVRGNKIHIHCDARARGGFNYPQKLEYGFHPFVRSVLRRYRRELATMIRGPFGAFLVPEGFIGHDHEIRG